MDYRRRPTISRLTLLATLVFCASAQAALQVEAPAEQLRTLVPDAIYADGVTADFTNIQLRDSDSNPIPFAVCPLHETERAKQQVPVLALPDLARPILNREDRLAYERSTGAGPASALRGWVLDLREINTPVSEIFGVPPIAELRDSPSLRQWSAPIDFLQTDGAVKIDSRPLKFVKLQPKNTLDWPQVLPDISVLAESASALRTPHWYQPLASADGDYEHTRDLAVFAARVINPASGERVVLQSRTGPWDAWKPRASWDAIQDRQVLRFSALSDPEWRLLGSSTGQLELAHAAHELRIKSLQAGQNLQLSVAPTQRRASTISCQNSADWPALTTLEWTASDLSRTVTESEPANLRKAFLMLLACLVAGLTLYRKLKAGRSN